LICSHSECQKSGIKSPYCRHCKLPVAKRTFTRHLQQSRGHPHEDEDDDPNSKRVGDSNGSTSRGVIPCSPARRRREGLLDTSIIAKKRSKTIPTRRPSVTRDCIRDSSRGIIHPCRPARWRREAFARHSHNREEEKARPSPQAKRVLGTVCVTQSERVYY
jgi:hypothetical protein